MAKKLEETNPFVQSLEIRGVWKLDFEHKTQLRGNESSVTYAQSRIIDGDDRASVYSAGLMTWFKPLTSSAKDMFMYVAIHLGHEKDVIELTEDDYCQEMGVGRTTFYNAKTELTNRLLIPRKKRKNTYWVNPAYLFKGNRIAKFPDNIRTVNDNPLKDPDAVKSELSDYEKLGHPNEVVL